MTELQLESIVSQLKALEDKQHDNRSEIKELQLAMVGTVDGSRKGFGQQLVSVMEALDKLAPRIEELERFKLHTEGAWVGGKITVAFIGGLVGLLVGIIGMLIAMKK